MRPRGEVAARLRLSSELRFFPPHRLEGTKVLIGKEIGMFVDRAELRIQDRLASKTPEQRAEDARITAAEIRRRLEIYRQIEGEAVDVTSEDEPDC